MAETATFTRSELVRIAGVEDDAVAFWLRSNLLLPEDRGARKHRRFTRREVKIAALLRELRNMGLNVSAMAGLVGELRRAQVVFDHLRSELGGDSWIIDVAGGYDPEMRDMLDGNFEHGRMTAEQLAKGKELQLEMTREAYLLVSLASDFEEAENTGVLLLCVARNEHGDWHWIGSPESGYLDANAAIVLNLARMMKLPWPEAQKAGAE